MKKSMLALVATFAIAAPAFAQEGVDAAPSPNEIVEAAPQSDWVGIAPEDLLVMTLAPDAQGNPRNVVIQLMPAPFSQGWVENIRTLARAGWYDDITVNRVQDNYVVQWGDLNYDNPEAGGEVKPLPDGLRVMDESAYESTPPLAIAEDLAHREEIDGIMHSFDQAHEHVTETDSYGALTWNWQGWPIAGWAPFLVGELDSELARTWPVHCYGMVGVGRSMSPDTGSGAELYTVIGHAPRHLDRNIALVGRIIEGMQHLSSLPRGSGALGFYTEEEAGKRTAIRTVRVASDLPRGQQPRFEYLSSESDSFARYAEARANRRDPFFIVPAGGADISNIPVPIRRAAE